MLVCDETNVLGDEFRNFIAKINRMNAKIASSRIYPETDELDYVLNYS